MYMGMELRKVHLKGLLYLYIFNGAISYWLVSPNCTQVDSCGVHIWFHTVRQEQTMVHESSLNPEKELQSVDLNLAPQVQIPIKEKYNQTDIDLENHK